MYHQRMVASLAAGEIDQRDRRLSARDHERIARALELRDASAQFENGRGAVQTVRVSIRLPPVIEDIALTIEYDGRAAMDGRGQ